MLARFGNCLYLCNVKRTKRNNKHNEDKTRKAARHITGQGTLNRAQYKRGWRFQLYGWRSTSHWLRRRKEMRTAKIITRVAEVAANNRFSPQRRKLGYLPWYLKQVSNNQNGENEWYVQTLAIVKVCVYHAPGTVARLSYGQKNLLTLYSVCVKHWNNKRNEEK